MDRLFTRRTFTKLGAATAATVAMPGLIRAAKAADAIQVGLPTKNYWGTVLAKVAESRGFFEREGVAVEFTIYRSGAECVQALAAGAAHMVETGASSIAIGRAQGIGAMIVSGASVVPAGWMLMSAADSPIQTVEDLRGKNVGITSAGSFSEVLAKWAQVNMGVDFGLVPLGGAGLMPNLLAGNIDAAVVYPPVSFIATVANEAKPILDYAQALPPAMSDGWVATDKLIAENPSAVQGVLNALYGAVKVLQEDRAGALEFIQQYVEVSQEVAELYYDQSIMTLLRNGEIETPWIENVLEMARLGGATEMAAAEEIYTTQFVPVPTEV